MFVWFFSVLKTFHFNPYRHTTDLHYSNSELKCLSNVLLVYKCHVFCCIFLCLLKSTVMLKVIDNFWFFPWNF